MPLSGLSIHSRLGWEKTASAAKITMGRASLVLQEQDVRALRAARSWAGTEAEPPGAGPGWRQSRPGLWSCAGPVPSSRRGWAEPCPQAEPCSQAEPCPQAAPTAPAPSRPAQLPLVTGSPWCKTHRSSALPVPTARCCTGSTRFFNIEFTWFQFSALESLALQGGWGCILQGFAPPLGRQALSTGL